MEVILFKWLYLISLIFFSNVGSGSNFAASIMLFILTYSKFSSKDASILEICFSCTMNCDGNMIDIQLIISVSSESHSVYELRGTNSYSIYFDS